MLVRLAADFDSEATPYASRPDPAIGPSFPRYDHLARVDEWRIAENGAALAGMAMCDRFADGDVTALIRTGDEVSVDPADGLVTITSR